MKNKEYEFYVARDKNDTLAMYDVEPILDPDSSEWISANGKFREIDSHEYSQVTFENSPMKFTIVCDLEFDDGVKDDFEFNVGDIFTYSDGIIRIFNVVASGGDLYYIDDICFNSDLNVGLYNHSMTAIDIVKTFKDLKRVENMSFTQFMKMKISALNAIEVAQMVADNVSELYNEYKSMKGENQ